MDVASNQYEVTGFGGRKLACTVIMMRDSAAGLEVYVQERVSSMPTFPNATVFPGGGVDRRDFEAPADQIHSTWSGPGLSHWAKQLEVPEPTARALVFGAARELFEETGTLLASHYHGGLVQDATPYHQQRLALESHQLSLSEMLAHNDLVLRTDLLRPFAHWASGDEDPHHYDVYSFLAIAPAGQEPDGNTSEAASTGWFTPKLILQGWRAGLLHLVIPTWAQLSQLSHYDSVAEVLAACSQVDLAPIVGDPVDDERYSEYFEYTPPPRFIFNNWGN